MADELSRIDRRLAHLKRGRDEAIAELNAERAAEFGQMIDALLERRMEAATH